MDMQGWNMFLNSCLQLGVVHLTGKARKVTQEANNNVSNVEAHSSSSIYASSPGLRHTGQVLSGCRAVLTNQSRERRQKRPQYLDLSGQGADSRHAKCVSKSKPSNTTLRIGVATPELMTNMKRKSTLLNKCKWRRMRNLNVAQKAYILEHNKFCAAGPRQVAYAQAAEPLSSVSFYYTVEVLELGCDGYIAIGLTDEHYPCNKMPGWEDNSIAYHADDGKIYFGSAIGTRIGPSLKKGDTIACGILYNHNQWSPASPTADKNTEYLDAYFTDKSHEDTSCLRETVKVFFSVNNKLIGIRKVVLPPGGSYPAVGMLSSGAKVKVNLRPQI